MLDSQQPTEFDVVLGGQFPPPMSGAAVLGGMEGVIQRLASPLSAEQYAALQQLNQKCRKSGLDLLKQALVDETEYLQRLAYTILRQQPQPEVQEFLLQNMPYHLFEPVVTIVGSYTAQGCFFRDKFAFMPNSQQLLTVLKDNSVKLWDLRSGELVQILEGFEDRFCSSRAIVASPDGQSCYIGYSDGKIRQRDLRTGDIIRTLKGRSTCVNSLAISKNGSTLVVGSQQDSPEIDVWDLQSGQSYALKGSACHITYVDVSGDGRYAISYYIEHRGAVEIWDLQQRRQLHTLTCPDVTKALISPDGKRIIVKERSLFTEWSIETGEKLSSLSLGSFLNYNPNTAQITSQPQQRKRLWNPRSNSLISEWSDWDYYLLGDYSPDGHLAVFDIKLFSLGLLFGTKMISSETYEQIKRSRTTLKSKQDFMIIVVGIRAIAS